jgi:hypothetical protein
MTACENCVHKDICSLTQEYKNAVEALSNLDCINKNFTIDLKCSFARPEIATPNSYGQLTRQLQEGITRKPNPWYPPLNIR